jgi:hypothetical protein
VEVAASESRDQLVEGREVHDGACLYGGRHGGMPAPASLLSHWGGMRGAGDFESSREVRSAGFVTRKILIWTLRSLIKVIRMF